MPTKPDRVIWLFGAPRTGSTWLADMLETMGMTVWREPMVGVLFGNPYYVQGSESLRESQHRDKHFILGRNRTAWLRAIRFTVLDGAVARFGRATEDGYLLIKEPNGSLGAPLLMAAVPESCMILLIRDPRDAVASALDAGRQGGWWATNAQVAPIAVDGPGAGVQGLALTYVLHVTNARKAFDEHPGRKVMVRYEELRSNARSEVARIHSALGLQYSDALLDRAVTMHAWENVNEEKKGPGKFHRRASPGSWTTDLSDEQVAVVERIAGALIDEFYPGTRSVPDAG